MPRFDGATFLLRAASTRAFAAQRMLNSHIGLPIAVSSLFLTIQAAGMHFADRSYRAWLDAAYTYGRNDVIFARDRKQEWLLPTIRQEFLDRHFLIRSLVRVCRGRSWLTRMASVALKLAADGATFLRASVIEGKGIQRLVQPPVLQWLFNELDDVQFFFKDLRQARLVPRQSQGNA